MLIIELLALRDIKIAFSPSGHGLMTLIISFLGLAKVNLSYDRYMSCRHSMGHALSSLRELNQVAMTYTQNKNGKEATQWRQEVRLPLYHYEVCLQSWTHCSPSISFYFQVTTRIVDVIDCLIRVLKVCLLCLCNLNNKLASLAHHLSLLRTTTKPIILLATTAPNSAQTMIPCYMCKPSVLDYTTPLSVMTRTFNYWRK